MKKFTILVAACLFWSVTTNANPATYQDAMQEARQSFEAKNYPEAGKSLEAALLAARTPDEKARALALLGRIYTQEKKRSKADEMWNQIIALKGTSGQYQTMARYALAGSYLDQRRFEETRNLLGQVISSPDAPPNIMASARLAFAGSYANQGKSDLARVEFEKIASDAKLPASLRVLAQREVGQNYFKAEKWELARAAFETALSLAEVSVVEKAASQLGIIQTYEKQFGRKRALDEVARFHIPLLKNAEESFKAGKYAQARLNYAALLTIGYLNPALTWFLQQTTGETYFGEGKWAEGRQQMERILAAQPNPHWPSAEVEGFRFVQQSAQYNVARSYETEGNKAQAKAEFQKLLQMADLHPSWKTKAEAAIAQLS